MFHANPQEMCEAGIRHNFTDKIKYMLIDKVGQHLVFMFDMSVLKEKCICLELNLCQKYIPGLRYKSSFQHSERPD